MNRDWLEVLEPGPLTTVQDHGRPGWAHLGVPRSGSLDRSAADLANRLVGNPVGAAVLECTLSGPVLRVHRAVRMAFTGARCEVRVDGRSVPMDSQVVVPSGAVVSIGAASSGARTVVAVAGGIAVDPVLGSRSTDLLSGTGPPPLARGRRLPVGEPGSEGSWTDVASSAPRCQGVFRVLPGPQADWFVGGATALAGRSWEVGASSNRVGVRLHGEPLRRHASREGVELPSQPLVLGAVQVPASGEPVVFLADHPTTGGYPVVAVVDPADLDRWAQLRPGDPVHVTARAPRAEGRR